MLILSVGSLSSLPRYQLEKLGLFASLHPFAHATMEAALLIDRKTWISGKSEEW
jgi:hypothetical protein